LKDDHEAYKIIEQRLILKINQNNLIADNKIIFIPNLSRNGFNTLMRAGKVLLDTIYFSGFNTPMQALGCGLPVVTLQGQFMRSRAATGILKRIHLEELIAKNSEMYIGLIYKLISDQEFYKEIKNKIKDNVGLLYRDTAPIRSLENFFTEVLMGGKN
jgi:predicted O-linked N-acetylglucosamine transferase (SPINDLY family)